MKKKKLYRYIGINGIITSFVLLENIKHIDMYELKADIGMILTNGEKYVKSIEILAENLAEWKEIPINDTDNKN